METKKMTNTFAAAEVNRLELRVSASDVEVKEAAASGEIRVEAEHLDQGHYVCEVRDGKLVVSHKFKKAGMISLMNQETVHITLYMPAGMSFEHIVLEAGAGNVKMEEVPISCKEMSAEIGAGKWRAAKLSVTEKLSVQIGAGKVKLKEITVGSLSVDCGVGKSAYKGRVNRDITVNCGVGSCNFQLDNKETDFNYKLSCALGSIRLNGNKIGGLGSEKIYSDKKALGTAVLECGLGSIELNTV